MANEKRLIDANALIAQFDDSFKGFVMARIIDEQPTVDAVEVVQCKACEQHIETKAENVVYCKKFNRFMKVDDFCSYGERRSDV